MLALIRPALLLAALLPAALAAETDPTYALLRAARPGGPAVTVRGLTIERDVFRFRFEKGVFQFVAPVEGRVTGAVFVGEGSWQLRPAVACERRQLALETGEKNLEVLEDRFGELVLLFTDGTAAEIASGGTPAPEAAPARLGEVWDRLRKRQRRELKANLQLRLLADVLRPPDPSRGVFLAFVDGERLPLALAAVDPEGPRWMPRIFLLGAEDSALYVVKEREGGTWYLARRKSEGAGPPAGRAVRGEHYAIDTTIRKNEEVQGETTIRLRILTDGLRVLPLGLLGKLRIGEASFASADGDAWTRAAVVQEDKDEDSDAGVVFPSPLSRGDVVRLRVRYGGSDVLQSAGDGNFIVGARESWYPNVGVFQEPATYDLTFRVPRRNDVVSVGDSVENRVDGDTRIAVWRASRPIRVAGFNYGTFKKLERRDDESGLTIQVFTNPGKPDVIQEIELSGVSPEALADSAMADGINTARVGAVYFGSLPFGHVAITQQSQWFFGQSWPSLIFLPYLSFLDSYNRFRLGLQSTQSFVDLVGPHEFAHQWWGHLVGWESYRDQWLSEGLAEFTAGLVIEIAGGKSGAFWEKAKKNIVSRPTRALIANDEAGPISQGMRLATWRNFAAAQAMVYDKGAYVVHMLRMLMRDAKADPPDAPFIAMMKDFVASYADKNPSTRDFQAVVERHMTKAMDLAGDGRMDWFFRQWVDGMEIPRYVAKLEAREAGGDRYEIKGTVAQEGVSDDFIGFAPLYVELDRGSFRRLGMVTFRGATAVPVETVVSLPKKPRRALVNAHHDVLERD